MSSEREQPYPAGEEEWLRGGAAMTTIVNETNAVSISTRTIPDIRRWEQMPSLLSLKNYSNTLVVLDLHKSRYLTDLHGSVCHMASLKKLVLTHCHKLKTLPEHIGKLKLLEEVSYLHICNSRFVVRRLRRVFAFFVIVVESLPCFGLFLFTWQQIFLSNL
jgi:hypothetical protein